jgi:hypothetical protein
MLPNAGARIASSHRRLSVTDRGDHGNDVGAPAIPAVDLVNDTGQIGVRAQHRDAEFQVNILPRLTSSSCRLKTKKTVIGCRSGWARKREDSLASLAGLTASALA